MILTWLNPILKTSAIRKLGKSDLKSIKVEFDAKRFDMGEIQVSVWRIIVTRYSGNILAMMIVQAFATVCLLMSPVIMQQIIFYIEGMPNLIIINGYVLVTGLFLVQFFSNMSFNYFLSLQRDLIIKTNAILMGIVYEKGLFMSPQAASKWGQGRLLNLIDQDIPQISSSITTLSPLFSLPIRISIIIYLLHYYLNDSLWWGFLTYTVCMLTAVTCLFFNAKYTKGYAAHSDTRVKRIREALYSIYYVKTSAIEEVILSGIAEVRAKQIKQLNSSLMNTTFMTMCTVVGSSSIAIVSIFFYSKSTLTLDPAILFPSLALFAMLSVSTQEFGSIIETSIAAYVSLNRLSEYLSSPSMKSMKSDRAQKTRLEKNPNHNLVTKKSIKATVIYSPTDRPFPDSDNASLICNYDGFSTADISGFVVRYKNASFSHTCDATPWTLRNITLDIREKSHTVIIGRVGSGKTSLLISMLDGIDPAGNCFHNHAIKSSSKFSYSPQRNWIFSGTVKDNITFGISGDSVRLNEVVRVCGLKDENFPNGIDTLVSEQGYSLSGGQASRISLARALYHEADVYILDDPLASLDSVMRKFVFENAIRKFLISKTVILVSSNPKQILVEMDQVILMDKGEIAENDTAKTYIAELNVETKKGAGRLDDKVSILEEMAGAKDGEFGEDEEVEEGSVKNNVYFQYFKAGGANFATLFPIALVYLCMSGFGAASSYWIAKMSTPGGLDTATMIYAPYIYVAFNCGLVITQILSLFILYSISVTASIMIHGTALSKLLSAPLSWFENHPIGRILNRFSGDIQAVDCFMMSILFASSYSFSTLFSSAILIACSSYYMIILIVVFGAIYYRLYISYAPAVVALKRLTAITKSPLVIHINQTLEGKISIHNFGLSETFIVKQHNLVNDLNQVLYHSLSMNIWISIRIGAINSLITLAIGLIGISSASNPTLASYIALGLSSSSTLTDTISRFLAKALSTEQQFNAFERLLYYATDIPQERYTLSNIRPLTGAIRYRNLSLAYPSNPNQNILKSVDLDIKAGEKIGIVGRTASGKSSLVAALFRTVEHSGGSIDIDNQDISQMNLSVLRSSLAIVPQKPAIFTGTIRSNLVIGHITSDEEIWRVLEMTSLAGMVRQLPQMLDAEVKSEGGNFSSGEIQLLAIARALLSNAKILVLDEATSMSDQATQRSVTKCVDGLQGVTVLCIAHRLKTVEGFDKILVMDNGTVAEFDTPRKLMNNPDSHFRKLMNSS